MRVWDPLGYLHEMHPDVQVVESEALSGRFQGCVDVKRRIIWLAPGLDEIVRRCTLAFEIAQLEQGPMPENECLARAYQREAEDWAARRLLPIDRLIGGFRVSGHLREIARLLEVDSATLRSRLRGLTDEEQDGVMEAIYEGLASSAA